VQNTLGRNFVGSLGDSLRPTTEREGANENHRANAKQNYIVR
jgi:hypothetical protein